MNLTSIFTGVPQSRYAGLAVLLAIVVVSISILFGKESMPLSQKIGAILLLIIVSAPGILFSLFQLTCLVTGAGIRNQRWWCGAYAWIITALLVVYSVLLVAVSILSISTDSKVIKDLTGNVENFENANNYAANIFGVGTPSGEKSTTSTNISSSKTDNKAYSYSSSVLPVEQFRGAIGDANNNNSRIVGGQDEPASFPYDDGTLNPKEKFTGIVGDPNNRGSRVVGGMDEASSYPFN